MIINNTLGFIFVHVPKAAGTSVTNLFSKFSRYCDLEVGGTVLGEVLQAPFFKRYGLSKHSTAMEIRAVVGEELWCKYFTFGFVRNPYERAFSAYHFLKRMRAEKRLESLEPIDQCETFRDFVLSDYFKTDGMDRILAPQFLRVRRDQQTNELGVNFIGKVENIEDSIGEILKIIMSRANKPPIVEPAVPILNQSVDSETTVWPELAEHPDVEEAIYQKFEIDFRLFGYPRRAGALNPDVVASAKDAAVK